MFVVSAVSLFIVMVACAWGVCAPRRIFDDNIPQRVGMAGVFFFALPRFIALLENGFTANCMPASAQLLGHVGMALYSIGTAYKVWKHNAKLGKKKPPLPPISDEHLRRVFGGQKH